jgi:hypothetical protein
VGKKTHQEKMITTVDAGSGLWDLSVIFLIIVYGFEDGLPLNPATL